MTHDNFPHGLRGVQKLRIAIVELYQVGSFINCPRPSVEAGRRSENMKPRTPRLGPAPAHGVMAAHWAKTGDR